MAPRSLRRSRIEESDDDVSRPSTPASTAPRDGKRARRSLASEQEPSSDPTINDSTPRQESQRDTKPVVSNEVASKRKPKHQPGAIVRVKLTNFVTYTSAEFFPGPNLNMVIGPNGTGKSTLVCAICLGLGWPTQYLGRAKDAAEFVKHGCREATIEIELQRSTKGQNSSITNPIITRTIKREGNKSTYSLNGQSASAKAVMQLARSFNIQIDNLCQFLPQDKVVEFAQMTPIEILQSTQRAAAPEQMLELHEHLKGLRKAQKESNDTNKHDREALTNLENRQEMQRTEVERLRERAIVQKRLGWLQKCRPIPQYAEARKKTKEAKQRQKTLEDELKQLRQETGPAMKKVEKKRLYAKHVQEHRAVRERDLKNAEKECDRLARVIENHETAMADCDHIHTAEMKSIQPTREDINRTRVSIATLKKRKEQAPEPFDTRAMNEDIQELVSKIRTMAARGDEIRSTAADLQKQGHTRSERRKALQKERADLSTEIGKQEDLLKTKSNDSYRAWKWIQENRGLFQKHVFGPPMIECTLKDQSMASAIESVLQQNDFRIFTVQCREDFTLLQRELMHNQRLHDISLRVCPFDNLDNFKSPLSFDEMQRYGLNGWAIDLFDGPPAVLAMLCQEKFLHQTAITDQDISQAQHDQLGAIPAVKNYVTKNKSYQFIRRAEYGAAGITARERSLRRPEIWANQPVDTSRTQQINREIREIEGEIMEVKSQLPLLNKEFEELKDGIAENEEQLKALRNDKDEKQKAQAEYNGLDTKIAQAEEKESKLKQTLENVKTRLEENKQKKDEAMFAKADATLQYCDAVHVLQEKLKAVLEIQVMSIEARNDVEILAQRNQAIVDMLATKEAEEREARNVALKETARARELVVEVKRLRDDGIALEQEEHDDGLTTLLEELTTGAQQIQSEGELDELIEIEQAKLELTEGGDLNTIKEYEERAKKIEHLRKKLSNVTQRQRDLLTGIREVRDKWEAPLETLVAKISDAFGDSFARIGCAGQVAVFKASSDDPADCTEELGGQDNGLDFANWAIHISVKFRENEPLSLLDSHRQSGGERAVSTIFYLMALQSLSRAPFRVVDEINQGMDPRNERMVHGRMVDIAAADDQGADQGSQYFLITPKLLSGLKYKPGMTVLCIVSGENMPNAGDTKVRNADGQWVMEAGRKIDFAEFARRARALSLNHGAGKRIDGGVRSSSSFDLNSSQPTTVGA